MLISMLLRTPLCLQSALRLLLAMAFVAMHPYAQGSTETIEIAKFFDAGGRAEFGMKQAILQLEQSDPKAAAEMSAAFSSFNGEDIVVRLGTLFDQFLTAEDIDVVLRFAQTPAGKLYGVAFKDFKEPVALAQRLGQLRGMDRSAALEFQNSPTFTRLMQAMRSQRARQISSEYGEELMCHHFLKNDIQALKVAKSRGKCSDVQ